MTDELQKRLTACKQDQILDLSGLKIESAEAAQVAAFLRERYGKSSWLCLKLMLASFALQKKLVDALAII